MTSDTSAPQQADGAPAGGAISRTATIVNQKGLHARAAARFVKLAATFDAAVTVTKKESTVSGVSIMGLMMLAASPGCQIEIRATGREAERAADALAALVAAGFDES
ncbi:MAG TPA: HPr family phosphocarrier protein [Alphaproteobacteria bacterium]|nr:HPr family phosphocarrier protein [Alphaproteobacteria bacterium]